MWTEDFYIKQAENPDWSDRKHVHDWEAYAGEDLRAIWPTLTLEARVAIVKSLQEIADREEWD